ncbi:stalk domain-containing protein [Desulfofundulus thermocisternus]|uniref:stalk domain-containing protein n=1 Tax=Desulfofundulus thermocisternus TaxID=42471 RepID=UPI0012FF57E0|nr:stalk domain-containing protein [Desulfofundulus thermocisternus]
MRGKAVFALLLALTVLAVAAVPAFAYEGPAPYTTTGGVFMVPLRWMAEANGADLVVDAAGAVVVTARKVEPPVLDEFYLPVKPGRTLERVTVFRAGQAKAWVRGVEIPMPAPAEIRDGRLFVPVQFALLATRI